MTGHGAKFGRKQEEAIAALLSHRSIEEAAKAINVAPRTLMRWLKIPEFNKAYRAARREAVSHATARLQQGTGVAASVIMKLLLAPDTPPPVRLRAAECVFGTAIKSIELDEVEARVSELERAAGAAKDTGGRR